MIKFISANGLVEDCCDYYSFTIENGNSTYCIGDQVWMNETEMEISDMLDEEVLEELLTYFEHKSGKALKGALRRVGIVQEKDYERT